MPTRSDCRRTGDRPSRVLRRRRSTATLSALEASVFLRCPCGYTLTNVASPGAIPHRLLTDRGVERLQDAADREVAAAGSVASWPEHFEAAGAIETWVCPKCLRLFVHADGAPGKIVVYRRESVGLPNGAVGSDSQLIGSDFGSVEEFVEMALREQAGESPLAAASGRKHCSGPGGRGGGS